MHRPALFAYICSILFTLIWSVWGSPHPVYCSPLCCSISLNKTSFQAKGVVLRADNMRAVHTKRCQQPELITPRAVSPENSWQPRSCQQLQEKLLRELLAPIARRATRRAAKLRVNSHWHSRLRATNTKGTALHSFMVSIQLNKRSLSQLVTLLSIFMNLTAPEILYVWNHKVF